MRGKLNGSKADLTRAKESGMSNKSKKFLAAALIAGNLMAIGAPAQAAYTKQEINTHQAYVEELVKYIEGVQKTVEKQIETEVITGKMSKKQADVSKNILENSKEKIMTEIRDAKTKIVDKNNDYLKVLPAKEGDTKIRVELGIKNMSSLDAKQLKKLEKQYHIDSINMHRYYETESSDKLSRQFVYSPETYKKMQKAMKNKFGDLKNNNKLSDLEKVLIVNERIQKQLKYDYEALEIEDMKNPKVSVSRNMESSLLSDKTICAGYSDLLKNTMNYLGIEAKEIRGNKESGEIIGPYVKGQLNHNWNQVKLDGKWFNIDPTFINENPDILKPGASHEYLLTSDEEFNIQRTKTLQSEYKPMLGLSEKCEASYDASKIDEALIKVKIYEEKHLNKSKGLFANIGSKISKVRDKWFNKSEKTLALNEGRGAIHVNQNSEMTSSDNRRTQFLSDVSHNGEYRKNIEEIDYEKLSKTR